MTPSSEKTPAPSGPPSASTDTKLSARLSSALSINKPPDIADRKDATKEAEDARKEVLEVLMDPQAHVDGRLRFSQKLAVYSRKHRLDPTDIVARIASDNFGMMTFKVLLIGAGGVGKTSYVAWHSKGAFDAKYEPTRAAVVTPIVFATSEEYPVLLEVWDVAGIEKNGSLKDAYYVGADAAILMYDKTHNASYKALDGLYKDLRRVREDIPAVVVGNKVDAKKQLKGFKNQFQRKNQLQHYEVSTKTGQNIHQPFLYLVRKLTSNSRLRFASHMEHYDPKPVSSDDESEVAASTSQLAPEGKAPTKQAEALEAAALSLPPAKSDGGDVL